MSESDQKSCIVCKVQHTMNYDHYGCKGVCSSCRNFFRRSVHSGQFTYFECKIRFENGSAAACVIDSKNRKSCKKCRYQKCLEAGMQPNWVTSVQSGCCCCQVSCISYFYLVFGKICQDHVISAFILLHTVECLNPDGEEFVFQLRDQRLKIEVA